MLGKLLHDALPAVKPFLECEKFCTLPHCNSRDEKDRHINISLPQQGAFPGAPVYRLFVPVILPSLPSRKVHVWFSIPQSFLGACTTHVYGRYAAIIVEYLQTAAETVARDFVSEDVNLRSHFSSE
jgi:hypothetical protein